MTPPEDGDSEEDPFADLDADRDPDAPEDPFETFASAGSDPEESLFEESPEPSEADGFPDPDADPGTWGSPGEADTAGETPEIHEDDPFADLETDEELDDSVWEDLSVDRDAETVERGGRRISEVSKHSFCERCPHFSGPPRVACEHEGTEILEFLDMETVRVVDCPIVEERERLRGTNR